MAGTTKANTDAALKDLYGKVTTDYVNKSHWIWDKIKKQTMTIDHGGRKMITSQRTSRNVGFGPRLEGGEFPTPGRSQYGTMSWYPVNYYVVMSITGEAEVDTNTKKKAFVKLFDAEMKNIRESAAFLQHLALVGDGSGLLCHGVSNAADVVTVTSTNRLSVGMPIEILDRVTGVSKDIGYVGTIPSATTFTIIDAAGAATTPTAMDTEDGVYLAGLTDAATATSTNRPFSMEFGLEALVSETNPWTNTRTGADRHQGSACTHYVGEVDRTSNTQYQCVVEAGAWDAPLSVMTKTLNRMHIERGRDNNPAFGITSYEMLRVLGDVTDTARRYGSESMTIKGVTGMKFRNIEIYADRYVGFSADPGDAIPNDYPQVMFINPKSMTKAVVKDWSFVNKTGSIFERVGRTNVHEAVLWHRGNLIIDDAKKNGIADFTSAVPA